MTCKRAFGPICARPVSTSQRLDPDGHALVLLSAQFDIILEGPMTTISLKVPATLAVRLEDAARQTRREQIPADSSRSGGVSANGWRRRTRVCPVAGSRPRGGAVRPARLVRKQGLSAEFRPVKQQVLLDTGPLVALLNRRRPLSSVGQASLGTDHTAAVYLRSRPRRSLLSGAALCRRAAGRA